ncbi:MAG: hypothetical protein K2I91_03945, partial [Muribaculaceae bacterium]|nr:hypothetical protein [Muribaculaceae bacterium]
SIVHRMSDKRFHALEVTRQIEERMSKLSPALGRAASDRRFSANFNIFLLLCREEKDEYNRVKETCWREIKGRRRQILFNPRVRLKNRIGALISYSGRRVVEMLAGMMKG